MNTLYMRCVCVSYVSKRQRCEFIKERFEEKEKKTCFRLRKKVRNQDLDHSIDQEKKANVKI